MRKPCVSSAATSGGRWSSRRYRRPRSAPRKPTGWRNSTTFNKIHRLVQNADPADDVVHVTDGKPATPPWTWIRGDIGKSPSITSLAGRHDLLYATAEDRSGRPTAFRADLVAAVPALGCARGSWSTRRARVPSVDMTFALARAVAAEVGRRIGARRGRRRRHSRHRHDRGDLVLPRSSGHDRRPVAVVPVRCVTRPFPGPTAARTCSTPRAPWLTPAGARARLRRRDERRDARGAGGAQDPHQLPAAFRVSGRGSARAGSRRARSTLRDRPYPG